MALRSSRSVLSGSSMLLCYSIYDSAFTTQLSLLSFELSKSTFQLSHSSLSEMISGALFSSVSTGWQLVLPIRQIFNIWVRCPGMSITYKDSGNGDLSDNLHAAAPSWWKSDQDTWMISSVCGMYPTAVICLFWACHSFWVAHSPWLPCHVCKQLWTLAILCIFLSIASFCISVSFSVFIVSNSGSAPAKIPLLDRANCLTTAFSQRVSPVVFDCLQPISSRPREKLPSTPTPCRMIQNMSHATLQRLAC